MKHAFAHFPIKPPTQTETAIKRGLGQILRQDQISSRWADRLSYGRDCNSKAVLWVREGRVKYPPQWIVWPESPREVSRVLRFADENSISVVPFGGGSGVCGGTWALQGGIALDLKRMDRIQKIDGKALQATVQTGIIGEILERELNGRGYTLGHFPSSSYAATLGGYLSCRSAGQFSSYYGKIEDMVDGLEVVLPTGEIISMDSVKNRPGQLDLKEIFLGSEGTLGVMTQARLAIHPKPEIQKFYGFQFQNLEKGLWVARELMQGMFKPAVLRLYDPLDSLLATSYREEGAGEGFLKAMGEILGSTMAATGNLSLRMLLKKPRWVNHLLELMPSSCLMIVGMAGSKSIVASQVEAIEKICHRHQGKALGESVGNYWFQHRFSVSYKLSPYFDRGFVADTLETAATWSQLWPLYQGVREALAQEALVFAHFSHAYPTGCSIYFTFLTRAPQGEASETRYDRIWKRALDACVQNEGTISHHHGIGVLKAGHLRREWGESYEWLCRLKKTLDPENRMNPGKMGFPLHGGSFDGSR